MNSQSVSDARYNLIKAAAKRKGYNGIPDSLKPRLITERVTEKHAKSQTAETVDLGRTDDSILDEGANVELISPMLARCTGAEVEGHARDERRHFLSPQEKRQAAEDLWRYRHPSNLWLVPVARLTA